MDNIPGTIEAPCGNVAYFDHASGCGYRCGSCFAMLGSVGMPRECEELARAALAQSVEKK